MSRETGPEREPSPETDAWEPQRAQQVPGFAPGEGTTYDDTVGETGDWFGEEVGLVALGLGALLFVFPEPATSILGFFLGLVGLAAVASDRRED